MTEVLRTLGSEAKKREFYPPMAKTLCIPEHFMTEDAFKVYQAIFENNKKYVPILAEQKHPRLAEALKTLEESEKLLQEYNA